MNTSLFHIRCASRRALLVLALLSAGGAAHGDDDLDPLVKPDSATVSVGAMAAMGSRKDRSLAGQYKGWGTADSAAILDFDYVERQDETGTWTTAEGRNLGLDNRELRFSRDVQGQWKIAGEYEEQVRHDPWTLNSALRGIGTSNPSANAVAIGAGADTHLDLKRRAFGLTGVKWLTPNLTLEAHFKTEDKEGARLSGIGGYCSNAISPFCSGATSTVAALFLVPEPVHYTTQQLESELHYTGDKLSLSGGYYGSFFNNANATVALGGISGVLGAGATPAALAKDLAQPVALAPDNQAHQLYVSGTYALEPTTRVNFKLAYTHATQNESFGGLGAGSLDGAIDTTLAQASLTMRPLQDLTLHFSGRYEDRQDHTRLANYLVDDAGNPYTNAPSNASRVNAKAEVLYRFSNHYRGQLTLDYASVNRDRPVASTFIPETSLAALRERTNEVGVRAELRRSMAETVNAAISVAHSERDGYRWYSLAPDTGFAFISYAASHGLDGTFPMTMVDRSRDSVKLMVDWAATDALSLQGSYEDGKDRFKGPTAAGVNGSDVYTLNLDASYQLNDQWALNAYASTGNQTLRMRQAIGYIADLGNLSTAVGLGASGAINARLQVGGNVSYIEDRNSYQISMGNAAAVTQAPPDEIYRSTVLKLYGKYVLDKASAVQIELIHQHTEYDPWAWGSGGVPFAATDGSTVSIQPVQNATFIGARYVYQFN